MTDVLVVIETAPQVLQVSSGEHLILREPPAAGLLNDARTEQILLSVVTTEVLDSPQEFAILELSVQGVPGPPGPKGSPLPIEDFIPLISPAVDAAIGTSFNLVTAYQLST